VGDFLRTLGFRPFLFSRRSDHIHVSYLSSAKFNGTDLFAENKLAAQSLKQSEAPLDSLPSGITSRIDTLGCSWQVPKNSEGGDAILRRSNGKGEGGGRGEVAGKLDCRYIP